MRKDCEEKPAVARRTVLKAAALLAAPMILPTGAYGRGSQPGANGKIVTGHIGTGPRGRALLEPIRENAGGICDVDELRARQAAAFTRPGTKTYSDYRDLLARTDIDAVVIASPDHWHAIHAVHACEAGKDVYLETPVCRTPLAGRKILQAASRFGSVVQSGTVGRSTPAFAALKAALPGIGAVSTVQCWGTANPMIVEPNTSAGPPPESLRWNLWLGPATERPYDPRFVEDGWRWALDFGGGQIMRQGAQVFESVVALLDCALDTNVKVTTSGEAQNTGKSDCPQPFEATFELDKPAVTIKWSQQPAANTPAPGFTIEGASGSLSASKLGLEMTVEPKLLEQLPEEQRTATPDPVRDWLRAIEKRSAPAVGLTHAILGANLAALANLSFRLRRPLAWVGAAGVVTGDEMATRMPADLGSGPWRI